MRDLCKRKRKIPKSEKWTNIGGQLFNSQGVRMDSTREEDDKNFYGVVAMCGHCGNGYYIPIMFAVKAKDLKSATEAVKNKPRVKKDAKYCILCAAEISETEYEFILKINDEDKYLTKSKKHPSDQNRRILMPSVIERRARKTIVPKDKFLTAKYSDEYEQSRILQKYFAPIKFGDKTVYPKHVDFQKLLKEYFTENTKYHGLVMHRTFALSYYVKLFGWNNELGIGINTSFPDYDYFTKRGKLLYHLDDEGKRCYNSISKEEGEAIIKSEHKFAKDEIDPKEIDDMIAKIAIESTNNTENAYKTFLEIKNLYGLYVETGSFKKNTTLDEIRNILEDDIENNMVEQRIADLVAYKERLAGVANPDMPSGAIEKFNRKWGLTKDNQGQGKV